MIRAVFFPRLAEKKMDEVQRELALLDDRFISSYKLNSLKLPLPTFYSSQRTPPIHKRRSEKIKSILSGGTPQRVG